MSNTNKWPFTLICNNCGAKGNLIEVQHEIDEDEEAIYYMREIITNGQVDLDISFGYETIEIRCEKCGQVISNEVHTEHKEQKEEGA